MATDAPTSPAGGPNDAVGRIMAERLRVLTRSARGVENVAGAAGSIIMGRVARATPDGYTIVVGQWGTRAPTGGVASPASVSDVSISGTCAIRISVWAARDNGQQSRRHW